MMKPGSIVCFGEIMRPSLRPHTLGPEQDANLLGMRWYGGGPFHRELKPAMSIAKKTHFIVRAGDVIYNKLFAWKGTFGIVPEHLDGMFVSDKFPTYELDRSRVFDRYLSWFFRYPHVWEQARAMSTGSAALSKLTLNPPRFLELEMFLPSLEAQIRIANKLDALAEKVAEAKGIRTLARKELLALSVKIRDSILEKHEAQGVLRDVLLGSPRNGWSPVCDNSSEGVPVLTLSAVTGWIYNQNAIKRTSLPVKEDAHYWLKAGDLLITRSNTPELVGHAAICTGTPNPCIYPDLIMKLPVDRELANTKFIWYWLQSTRARDFVRASAKGTSPTMKKISQGVVEAIPFPSQLSVFEQTQLVRQFDAMKTKFDTMNVLQEDTERELDAMLPAILDQEFGRDATTAALPSKKTLKRALSA